MNHDAFRQKQRIRIWPLREYQLQPERPFLSWSRAALSGTLVQARTEPPPQQRVNATPPALFRLGATTKNLKLGVAKIIYPAIRVAMRQMQA